MKALRWSLGIVGAAALLLVLAVIIATRVVNPDHYRGEVDRLVSRYTGRPFVIEGHLRLAWYPWLTLGIGTARLGNRPGMRGPDLIAWRAASIPVRLLPLLLHGRIEIGTIRVSGADIHLWRAADGAGNWQHLLSGVSGAARHAAPAIGGLILRDARLEFSEAGRTIRLSHWQLHLGAWASGQPVSVRTRFILQAPKVPPGGVPVRFTARRLRVQRVPMRFATPQWTLTVASAAASGALRFADADGQPRASGTLALTVPSLRGLIDRWGLTMRLPNNPAALKALSLSSRWQLRDGALRLQPLTTRLDATTLTGWAARSAGTPARWTFDLHANRIDFSDYLPPASRHPKPLKLPLATLRALRARGTLTVSRASLGGTTLHDLRLQVR